MTDKELEEEAARFDEVVTATEARLGQHNAQVVKCTALAVTHIAAAKVQIPSFEERLAFLRCQRKAVEAVLWLGRQARTPTLSTEDFDQEVKLLVTAGVGGPGNAG